VLTKEKITEAALIEDPEEFARAIQNIEKKLLQNRILVPLAHFPGVVAEAPGFERDEALSWSCGTQEWTYRIR
jgi:hypothetical protein